MRPELSPLMTTRTTGINATKHQARRLGVLDGQVNKGLPRRPSSAVVLERSPFVRPRLGNPVSCANY
jgi:hypothetical protein